MNEDETTKSLSDKVIDRGNVITFAAPKSFASRTKIEMANPGGKTVVEHLERVVKLKS